MTSSTFLLFRQISCNTQISSLQATVKMIQQMVALLQVESWTPSDLSGHFYLPLSETDPFTLSCQIYYHRDFFQFRCLNSKFHNICSGGIIVRTNAFPYARSVTSLIIKVNNKIWQQDVKITTHLFVPFTISHSIKTTYLILCRSSL